MTPALDQWLSRCARLSGMFGCAVQLPGQAPVIRSFNDRFPPAPLAEALGCLAESARVVSGHGLLPRWFTWHFELGQLRAVLRTDGALFLILAQADSTGDRSLEVLTQEFLALG